MGNTQITTLEQAAQHLISTGVVDMETMQVEGKQLLETCGLDTVRESQSLKRQIERHGFIDGTDFCTSMCESFGGRPKTVYQFTFNAANHVLLAAMTEQGKAARQDAIDTKVVQPALPHNIEPQPSPEVVQLAANIRHIMRETGSTALQAHKIVLRMPKRDPEVQAVMDVLSCTEAEAKAMLPNHIDNKMTRFIDARVMFGSDLRIHTYKLYNEYVKETGDNISHIQFMKEFVKLVDCKKKTILVDGEIRQGFQGLTVH